MGGLLRKLLIYICKPIYKLIKYMYSIFYNLANTRLFSNQDVIQQLSSNIYVLVSVVMLFAFSVTILSAIVNPDLLNDKKKGVTAIFKRSIIGLALMILIPFGFNQLYKIQENIMTNSTIEKIIVGADFSCPEEDENCEIGGNGGQVIAGTLISSVLYPADDEVQIASNVSESYGKMVTEDISYIGDVAKNINVTREGDTDEEYHKKFDDDNYAFNFDGLLAIVVGGATVYMLVIFAIDIAVRIFKLAFYELTAPISIVGYIAAGDKILSSWFKGVGKTFADLFIRIAAMAFYLFLVSNLSSFLNNFEGKDWSFVLKAFLIVGMLIFAKQVPNLISEIFGIKFESKGGIAGRLGEMAMVGKQAQKAWGAIKNAAPIAAGIGAFGAIGSGIGIPGAIATAGVTLGGKKLWDKKLKDTKFGSAIGTAGRGAVAVGKTAGAFAGGKGTVDAINSARNTWNGTEFGADMKYKKGKKADADFNKKIGLDENGRVKKSREEGMEFVSDQRRIIQETEANVTRNMKKDVGSNNAKIIEKLHANSKEKSTIESIGSKSKDVIDKLESMKLSTQTTDGKKELETLQTDFLAGDISATELRNRLQDLYSKGEVQASSVKKVSLDVDAIEGIISSSTSENINSLIGENGILKMNKISGMTKEITELYEKAKKDYDDAYKGQTESVKAEMDRYVSAYVAIDKSTIDVDKKSVNNTTDGQNFMTQINNTSVITSTTPSSSSQNTTATTSSTSQSQNSNSSGSQSSQTQQSNANYSDEDIMNMISEVQTQINDERLNNAWKNQTTDDTYIRGTFEPDRNTSNNYDDDYENIFEQQRYDDNE